MEISCPVSSERINENVIRIIAFLVMLIGIYSLLFVNFYVIVFLMVDFATRSFTSGKFSLLRFLAIKISSLFKLQVKLTDLAPKKFAATLGFVFCLIISTFYLLNLPTVAIGLTIVLLIFAKLESVFAICVGCHVYSLWQSIKKKK